MEAERGTTPYSLWILDLFVTHHSLDRIPLSRAEGQAKNALGFAPLFLGWLHLLSKWAMVRVD